MKLHPVLRWSLGVAFLAALVIWVQLTVGWVEVLSAWGRIPTSDLIAAVFAAFDRETALVGDIATVPRSLPLPMLPVLADIPALIVPAVSLAFVGLVQGAGVSAGFPNPDGSAPDSNRDFIGQGAGNVLAGLFRGMPVGGTAALAFDGPLPRRQCAATSRPSLRR